MITVQISGIKEVVGAQLDKIKALRGNADPIMRTVAMAVLPELLHRVHTEGKDATGSQIGTYSAGYMKVRTGNYKDGAKYKRGDKAGQFKEQKRAGEAGVFTDRTIRLDKNTGVFTGEDKVGKARPVYNRSTDPKVILSLTRQMENGASIIDTPEGYGIGYLNPLNFQKAMWCEETYGKKILSALTEGEKEIAFKAADGFTAEYLK